jgi:hypothetical protein
MDSVLIEVKDEQLHRPARVEGILHRMPGRPLVKFAALYFANGGFLNARAGLVYTALQSSYEVLIDLKTRESNCTSHRSDNDATDPAAAFWLIAGQTDSAAIEENQ